MTAPTRETQRTQAAGSPPRGRWIADWRPEDPEFWESTGKRVARRNLFFSIFSEHIGFSIWSLWSVLVLFLPQRRAGEPRLPAFVPQHRQRRRRLSGVHRLLRGLCRAHVGVYVRPGARMAGI